MASASDARVAISRETTFGTRVAPSRFLPLTAEDLGFEIEEYVSPVIGTGMWSAPSIQTVKRGAGSIAGDVMSLGFSYLVDALHPNTTTPVQQGATIAYLATHTLNGPPSKSYTVQVQTPPVTSNTLVPHEMLGVMFSGLSLSWSAAGVLSFNFPVVYRDLDLTQTNIVYVAPASYELFSFKGGSLSFGGVAETDLIGDGTLDISYSLRTDAHPLGSAGLMAKPVLSSKPTATVSTTADFQDNTQITRTLADTQGDVVLRFTGTNIASTYDRYVEVTLPDCKVRASRPTVSGDGPLSQPIEFRMASATNDPPVIKVMSTETTP